jgi:carbamoyltransferase
MGLAPYGNPESEQTKHFESLIKKELVSVKDDGSIWLNQHYFTYATGLRMVDESRWQNLFGFGRRLPESDLEQKHCNLALAIQWVTEEIVLKMAAEAKRLTGSTRLCMAGGVALNCVANGKLLKAGIFDDLFIQPAAGDAGGALGAALAAHHIYFNQPLNTNGSDHMEGSYLGPSYSDKEIETMMKSFKAVAHKLKEESLYDQTSSLLSEGNVVGWFQGRMEFGPRALGNRSILGDARDTDMQKKLNLKIKYREGFRPFAPAVLAEDCPQYFELNVPSPYMLLIANVNSSRRKSLPGQYHDLPLWEKLYYTRSDIQSVTHLDFSARIQTVHRETNPRFYNLLTEFKRKTGYGVLVNTSFNVRGEPIVCTPADAYRCFMRTEMDALVVGNYLFRKQEQPDWQNKERWMERFEMD